MGGDPVPTHSDKDRRLWEMMNSARKRIMREDYIPRKKIKWRIVYCPKCQAKVEYVPRDKNNFNGTMKCPNCGTRFKVPSLDGFINNKKKEKDQRRE